MYDGAWGSVTLYSIPAAAAALVALQGCQLLPQHLTALQAHEPIGGGDVGLSAVSGGEGDRLPVSQGPGCEVGHGDVQRVQGADAMCPGDLQRDSLDILLW